MTPAVEQIPLGSLQLSTSGKWSTSTDPRGVLTMRHPYEPSESGNGVEARCPLPSVAPGRRFLRFYLSDGYVGHETGNPELNYPPEQFPEARFVGVSVGDAELLRADVLGANPPVDERFYQIEIPDDANGDLAIRVEDVQSVDAKFATDVYWGLIAVVTVPEGAEIPFFNRMAVPHPSLKSGGVSDISDSSLPVLMVHNPSPFRRGELVTGGVPFPQGFLADRQSVGVADADGNALPSQNRTLVTWPDGSVKSLLLDMTVAVAAESSAEIHLESRDGNPGISGVSVEQDDDQIRVDTGAATFTFGVSSSIIEEVTFDGDTDPLKPNGSLCLLLNYDGFPSRFAGILPPDRLELIEQGPLRVRLIAEGAYPDVEGVDGLRYQFRFDLCAGSADIRLQHTVTNATPGKARLRALSVRLNFAGFERFDVDGESGAFDGQEVWLVQHTHENFYNWRYSDRSTSFVGEGAQNRGYVHAVGEQSLGISLRDMWQQHPNGFRLDGEGIQVDLWTSDRVPWVLGSDPPLELAEGEAKTHDILLAFDSADGADKLNERLAAFQEPLFAAASPQWYCASGLFGPIAVEDSDLFPEYENAVGGMEPGMMGHGRGGPWEQIVAHTHEDRPNYQRYGFRHFGDNPLIWGYQTKYRMWANSEYDVAHCAFTQFARSGDLRYLHRGRQAVLHNRDTDVIHASQEHPEWVGAPHGHWIDHAGKAPNLGHLWSEGMVEHYLLTGDERSLEVARGIADFCIRSMESGWGGSGERTAGWPMIALLGVWHGTGDDRYLQAATHLRDDVIEHQDDLRGVWSYKIYEQPAYEGGTVFMVDILSRSLMRYHLATGDEKSAAAIVRAADWVRWEAVTDGPEQPRAFYKQTPLCSRLGGCSPETFAYAYALTGDDAFHDLALRAYRATARGWSGGVPTAMMRDLPRILEILREG